MLPSSQNIEDGYLLMPSQTFNDLKFLSCVFFEVCISNIFERCWKNGFCLEDALKHFHMSLATVNQRCLNYSYHVVNACWI